MIAYLQGIIKFNSGPLKKSASLIVLTGGVGYRVTVLNRLAQAFKVDQPVELYTHQHIWEGGQELYGFTKKEELDFFLLLLDIPGIGPKSALNILNTAKLDDIRQAVIDSDPEGLSTASGLGKKTAEKLILGLKSHLDSLAKESDSKIPGEKNAEVIEALMSLGFLRDQARQAIAQLPPGLASSEERIRQALKVLGKKK